MPTSLVHHASWLVLGILVVSLPACHSQNERIVRRLTLPYARSSYLCDISCSATAEGLTEGNYYRTLTLIDGRLFVGGKAQLFSFDTTNLNTIESVPVEGSCVDASLCEDNYIRVIQELPNGNLLECGTNNANPYCQQRSTQNLSSIGPMTSIDRAASIVPFIWNQNSTGWLLTDDLKILVGAELQLIAAAPGRPAISKSVLRLDSSQNLMSISVALSTKDELTVLYANGPPNQQFVGDPISYNGRIYFFFREVAAEFVVDRAIYSRVAVICEDDSGGKEFNERYSNKDLVTFVKARLECSTGTSFPFHYNEIQDIYYSNDSKVVFAVFATQPPEVASSAVCAYRLDEIEALFLSTSKFRAQFSDGELWREVDTDPVTSRPAQCPDTTSYTDAQYSDILGKMQLMFDTAANKLHYESLGGARSNPLLMIDGERFTQIVVDENVTHNTDVMFIGTEKGTVLKAYLKDDRSEAKVVEEIILKPHRLTPVLTMLKSFAEQSVFVGTDEGVYKVPFQHCRDYASLQSCVDAQDPYCSWENGTCLYSRFPDICPPTPCNESRIIIHNCPSSQVSYIRHLHFSNHPLHLYVTAEAARKDNLSIVDNEITCHPCASLPYTESRSVSTCREFLALHINGSSTERENCSCSLVLEIECGATKTINFNITVDDSDPVLDTECLEDVADFDCEISRYKFQFDKWICNQAKSCGLEELHSCKKCP
ncbi:semaphorin-5B-like isoform X1 [Acanthaster planci]|uniref:Semaphorin-5B-like isoform X1 n=1 Tax=Acanthaster planci TaxID=133434 RepID=A0A8B7ZZ64_ACAPL|nr:semaphorin-5B-like isoform X1 [Acanthaster planci]